MDRIIEVKRTLYISGWCFATVGILCLFGIPIAFIFSTEVRIMLLDLGFMYFPRIFISGLVAVVGGGLLIAKTEEMDKTEQNEREEHRDWD